MTETTPEAREALERVERAQYPEIVRAVRWSDEDNGTDHFEPGVGFIVDDPDGLMVPVRWVEHLPIIEGALAGLDHVAPHPLDVDNIEWLAREGREPTIDESAVHCFVCGEYTPMKAMANSSRELWIAHRFLNEYFEGWAFDPGAGFAAALSPPAISKAVEAEREGIDLLRMLVAADDEAKPNGILDCIDNDGHPYQSAYMAGLIVHARMLVDPHPLVAATAQDGNEAQAVAAMESLIPLIWVAEGDAESADKVERARDIVLKFRTRTSISEVVG